MKTASPRPVFALGLLALAALYVAGIGWGLPSARRTELVYSESQRNDDFYRRVEANRKAWYDKIGLNLQAAFGRGSWSGTLLPPTTGFELVRHPAAKTPQGTMLFGYSSFMMRSVEQDEQATLNVLSRFRPKKLEFNPHFTQNGGAYIYPLAAFFGALHLAGALRLVPDSIYYYRNPGELAKLYKAGRLFSVLASLGCVVLIFLIGRELYDERIALWAALLFGTAPAVVAYSHVMKTHLPAAFWALWALLCCARAVSRKNPSELVKASVFWGLAVGCAKYHWILAVPIGISFVLTHRDWRTPRRLLTLGGLFLLGAAAFLATNPYALISWQDTVDESRGMVRWYQSSLNPLAIAKLLAYPLRLGLGPGVWLLALAGTAAVLRRRGSDRLLLVLSVPLVVITAFQMSSRSADPGSSRFLMPAMALLALLGARWAACLPGRGGKILLGLALGINLGLDALYDANFLSDNHESSNAAEAARWIEANVPAGAAIGMGTPAPMLDRFPPIRFSRYELVYFSGPLKDVDPRTLPRYYVTTALWVPEEFKGHYGLERVFDRFQWRGHAFRDRFTSANFPLALLVKKSPEARPR